MLDLAARLALRAQGHVEPNPLVGAVIVSDGRIIGMGHHRRFGGLHAEREALADCLRRGEDPRGATLYVTLEPCCHFGKQPPCTEAVLSVGIAKVVFARPDRNPVSAGGDKLLRQGGVECVEDPVSRLALGVGAPFARRVERGLPWVIAKWAQTIDGRIATRTGESKWISGEQSRFRVHRLRARVDAVLTGVGTVKADDPMLTSRGVNAVRRLARRVVADTDLETPLESALVRTAGEVPTIIACDEAMSRSGISEQRRAALARAGVTVVGVPTGASGRGIELERLLRTLLEEHGVATVLVEAGPGILGSLFEADLVDEVVVYMAPMLLGDELAKSVAVGRVAEQLTAARRFGLWRVKPLGDDVELTYRRR